jgi:O-methyltransferase
MRVHIDPLFLDIPNIYKDIFNDSAAHASGILQTGPAMFHNISAVRHVIQHNIPGVLVECGIWRAATPIAMVKTIQAYKLPPREIWMYDTFCGAPEPHYQPEVHCTLDEVKERMNSLDYPYIRYIAGKVEDTLPLSENRPEQIAFLRLDTDYYTSTKAELEWLEPLVSPGGIIVIDDYGAYAECRKAVDEYTGGKIFLNRIDEHVRTWTK